MLFGCDLYVCYWTPVHEVYPNYELLMFQPRTSTNPDLGSVAYCYIAYLFNRPYPLLQPSDVCLRGGIPLLPRLPRHGRLSCCRTGSSTHPGINRLCPSIPKQFTRLSPTRRFHIPTPSPLPFPRHAFRITLAISPSLLPKPLLTWPSSIFKLLPAATTAPGPPLTPL